MIIDFDNVERVNEVIWDETFASNPDKIEELKKFAVAFYNQEFEIFNKKYSNFYNQEFEIFNKKYSNFLNMRVVAIKANNLLALEVLWQVVYYMDRDSPSYENTLEEAAEFGNLKTFQHCLHAFMNAIAINGTESMDYTLLKTLAEKNSDSNVLKYLIHLEPCIVNGFLNSSFQDMDEETMEEFWDEHVEGNLMTKHKLYLKLSQNYIQ